MLAIFFNVISEDDKKQLNDLLLCVANGDKAALGEIYQIAGGRMLSVAMGIMRSRELADDVLQDSFIKVVRFCRQYTSGTNAYAWLCTIVRNTAYNKIKSENIRRNTDIDSFFDIRANSISENQTVDAVAVENALKVLTPRQRTVVWLRYYNDLTVRAIATELNMPRSTVAEMLKSAETKLKNLLRDPDN